MCVRARVRLGLYMLETIWVSPATLWDSDIKLSSLAWKYLLYPLRISLTDVKYSCYMFCTLWDKVVQLNDWIVYEFVSCHISTTQKYLWVWTE